MLTAQRRPARRRPPQRRSSTGSGSECLVNRLSVMRHSTRHHPQAGRPRGVGSLPRRRRQEPWKPVRNLLLAILGFVVSTTGTQALIITVTTTDNVSPLPGQTSLKQAIAGLHDGDTIRFNIPGQGPVYI